MDNHVKDRNGAQQAADWNQQERLHTSNKSWRPKRQFVMWGLALAAGVILVAILLALVLWYSVGLTMRRGDEGFLVPPDPELPRPPSPSKLHTFRKAAVCTDAPPCSAIGRDILAQNGSAVDAALAAMFCNGVFNGQSMGLGGGFIMTIYDRTARQAYSLIARDKAPAAATQDMFQLNTNLSRTGALATGVPGELRGYWEAWKRFHKLSWAEILAPTLEICRTGYRMSKHQRDVMHERPEKLKADPNFREMFVDPKTGDFYMPGTMIKPRKLCETLAVIADEGGDAMHNGSLTKVLVEDIQRMGGIITVKDLNDFRAVWKDPVSVKFHGEQTVYSAPPPGSGALLVLILNIIDGYKMDPSNIATLPQHVTTLHRLIEAYKFAFAHRTQLADPDFVNITKLLDNLTSRSYADMIRSRINDNTTYNDPGHYGGVYYNQGDHGTAHMSIVAPNGDAVSVTSTINLYYGAGVTSERTGIILNSVMDDFSVPGLVNYFGVQPSPSNFIAPGKRPLSSVSPTILVDKDGDVTMVIGASGGTKITTSVSSVVIQYLWLGRTIKEAIDASRLHHQLLPMAINYEYGVIEPLISGLKKLGHKTKRYRDRGSIVCAMAKQKDEIYANSDYRKGGEVFGLD